MKMQNQDTTGIPGTPPLTARRKSRRWPTTIGAIVVVALIVSVSALVFAQLRQRQSGQTAPPSGQWESVLKGYTLTSLRAARSNPAVIYACATTTNRNVSQGVSSTAETGNYIILRSTDFGTHWQDIGSKAGLGKSCQLAINPADSNDVYVATASSTGAGSSGAPDTLKHTTDGGKTWETIVPALSMPGLQSGLTWQPYGLSMAGKNLFGLQFVPGVLTRSKSATLPNVPLQLARLITSADGGHTWIVLDRQFQAARLGVRSYAVDPTNPATIYELVGQPLLPVEQANLEPAEPVPGIAPPSGTDGDLYKTTDSGATWQPVLKGLFFGSSVQLASNKPQVIYAGGTVSPLPLAASSGQPEAGSKRPYKDAGSFRLQVSSDGGAHWRDVPAPLQIPYVQGWFAGPEGAAYAYIGSSSGSGGQATAISGTVVPSGTAVLPPSTPQATPTATQGSLFVAQVPVTTPPPTFTNNKIQRYDPTTDKWTDLPTPAIYGALITMTDSGTNAGAILWFAGTTVSGESWLYRYVV